MTPIKKILSLFVVSSAFVFGAIAEAQTPSVVPASAAPNAAAPADVKTSASDVAPATAPPAVTDAKAAAATPPPPPVPNKGDVAWMLTCTALVLLMSIPALALFYGGLVRSKNMLSVLMQVFVTFSLITVLWVIYGYSFTFTEGSGATSPFFGGSGRIFFKGMADLVKGEFTTAATFSKGVVLPEMLYAAYQATFAAITCCLILGSVAERMKFGAVILFMVLWFTFSYIPVAHMVWFWSGPDAYTTAASVDIENAKAGLLWQWGALDFAGGTVVHINAGVRDSSRHSSLASASASAKRR